MLFASKVLYKFSFFSMKGRVLNSLQEILLRNENVSLPPLLQKYFWQFFSQRNDVSALRVLLRREHVSPQVLNIASQNGSYALRNAPLFSKTEGSSQNSSVFVFENQLHNSQHKHDAHDTHDAYRLLEMVSDRSVPLQTKLDRLSGVSSQVFAASSGFEPPIEVLSFKWAHPRLAAKLALLLAKGNQTGSSFFEDVLLYAVFSELEFEDLLESIEVPLAAGAAVVLSSHIWSASSRKTFFEVLSRLQGEGFNPHDRLLNYSYEFNSEVWKYSSKPQVSLHAAAKLASLGGSISLLPARDMVAYRYLLCKGRFLAASWFVSALSEDFLGFLTGFSQNVQVKAGAVFFSEVLDASLEFEELSREAHALLHVQFTLLGVFPSRALERLPAKSVVLGLDNKEAFPRAAVAKFATHFARLVAFSLREDFAHMDMFFKLAPQFEGSVPDLLDIVKRL